MSSDRVPFRSEVMGWSPQQLADYLRRKNLLGCDKTVLKNSISGSRFVNLTNTDLEKFPRLQAPLISKISAEMNKKEGPGIFRKKPSKYPETDVAADAQGWGEDEFDDEEFDDDDYESPYSGEEEGSVGDYESPTEDLEGGNDYEPPPSEPPEDLMHKLCPPLSIGDSDYIDKMDNHGSDRGPPPAVCPRPPVATPSVPQARLPRDSSLSHRDPSPHSGGRPPGRLPPGPPQIFRCNKPGKDTKTSSPIRGPHNTAAKMVTHPWKTQPEDLDPPSWCKPPVPPQCSTSINRSNSSARIPPNRLDVRREQPQDEAPKHNTFPLHNKSQPPRPGLPGPPSRRGDSCPPGVASGGSLPLKLQSALAEQRQSFMGRRPLSTTSNSRELDPRWYVGKVTRGQAEGFLRRLNKDGAYLVRDSTKQLAHQPFTLMVFYQDKVYNIQIRQQNQNFLLGTGLKVQESFSSVGDIISQYSQSPLLLIDAKNRNSSQQNQCLLSDPAGYHLTGQNRS